MNTIIRNMYKVVCIMALVLCSTGIAFAADTNIAGNDASGLNGYISMQTIKENPKRYIQILPLTKQDYTFFDRQSLRVISQNKSVRMIEVLLVELMQGENPEIQVIHQLYQYDMKHPKVITTATLEINRFTYNGKYINTVQVNGNWLQIPVNSIAYLDANILYGVAFEEAYELDWIEALKNVKTQYKMKVTVG